MKQIIVIIPCFREEAMLRERLPLILRRVESPENTKMIVVDAYHTDVCCEIVESLGVG